MDSLIRQHLASFATGKTLGQVDVPQIVLGLLNGMLKSDFQNEKSYIQWKNRQVLVILAPCYITNFAP